MGIIRAEIGRKRGHMPLRKLMKMAGDAIQKIKPVFLMSLVSVAQFLPPGSVDFDLLVIDEASRMRPEDALGLIARCRRIVVVGDKKQLPPTNFFDRMIADEAEPAEGEDMTVRHVEGAAPITDIESILSLCEARDLESQMLRWHYRSRRPSLIEVSNAEFYHRLVMPPAPVTERVAKRFLQYAQTGILEESRATGADFDSPFEAAVADAIERLGYKVEPQVGSAGFKIDLAVRDPAKPGRYMLAIECDGATYHSALWARERDRLRQQVFENLGWRFHRIWSTDWFYRRGEQLERLKQVLDAARAEDVRDLLPPPPPLSVMETARDQGPADPSAARRMTYEITKSEAPLSLDMPEIEVETLAPVICAVIALEGPIHRDEITRRIGSFAGKHRA